ncbi:MAG: AsmA-like C-terminal region-containing protein [Vicinamibacteraceae bacterium]
MQEGRPTRPGRRRISRRGWVAIAVLFAVLAAVLASLFTRVTPHVRDLAVKALNDRFDSETEIATLQVSLFPQPEVSGTGLVVRYKGRRDVAPLISIKSFAASASIPGLIFKRLHLKAIDLEGLEIRLPPGGLKGAGLSLPKDGAAAGKEAAPGGKGANGTTPAGDTPKKPLSERTPILIDTIRSRASRLQIDTDDPGKLPRVFEIHDLVMTDFGFDRAAGFEARVSNPKPKGEIYAKGTFGPWNTADPRMTALGADYEFNNANLDTIKGIGGILSSKGRFHGVLERIRVEGTTDTPDFHVDIAGQPVRLQSRFAAVVDGTNGNTWLEPVDVTLLSSSHIVARGEVVRSEDVKGRKVYLQVTIDDAKIEDILRLAIKSKTTPLTGQMKLQTTFLLPAGEKDVPERLQLDGSFSIERARFTSFDVQQRIDTLSRRGRGNTGDTGPSVVSKLSGRFLMKDGRIRLSKLTFAVPGSVVQLAGTFDLGSEQLDFAGHLLLDASLSETVTGFKSILVRVAQPFFRRPGGGTKIPIRVSGTPDKPAFGVDVKRALKPGN